MEKPFGPLPVLSCMVGHNIPIPCSIYYSLGKIKNICAVDPRVDHPLLLPSSPPSDSPPASQERKLWYKRQWAQGDEGERRRMKERVLIFFTWLRYVDMRAVIYRKIRGTKD